MIGVIAYLLLQVSWGDVAWLLPLAAGRRLEFPTAAVAAAAEAAAAVEPGQDPADRKQTLTSRQLTSLPVT